MSGKATGLTALQTRKQLLLLESDLNRSLLLAEAGGLKNEVHRLTGRVGSIGPLTALAAQMGTSFAGIFHEIIHQGSTAESSKISRLLAIFRGLRAGVSFWSELRTLWR